MRVIANPLGGGHFPPQRLCRTTFFPVRGGRVVEVDSVLSRPPRSICLARLSRLIAFVMVTEHDQGCRVAAVRKSGITDLTLVKETIGFAGSCGMQSMFHLGTGVYGSSLPVQVREWALAFNRFQFARPAHF